MRSSIFGPPNFRTSIPKCRGVVSAETNRYLEKRVPECAGTQKMGESSSGSVPRREKQGAPEDMAGRKELSVQLTKREFEAKWGGRCPASHTDDKGSCRRRRDVCGSTETRELLLCQARRRMNERSSSMELRTSLESSTAANLLLAIFPPPDFRCG